MERSKQWTAICVLLIGCALFFLMQDGVSLAALSPAASNLALMSHVIGVDAGHGGYDGGSVGASGVPEKDFNLAVALYLQEELESRGAVVVQSRTEDIALIDPLTTTGYKKRKELNNRLALFRNAGVEIMVSVHMNKYQVEKYRGAQVFYKSDEEQGKTLALCIQQALRNMDEANKREASAGDYYILGACPASVLVECGFLSNKEEEKLLLTEEYRRKIASAIADGVADYFAQQRQH